MWSFRVGIKQFRRRSRRSACRTFSTESLEYRCLLTAAVSFDGGHAFSPADFHPDLMAVGNLNGDAFEDVVVANYFDSPSAKPLNILLGNGNGTFRLNSSVNLGERADGLRLGDYNGDGKTDVFYIYARRDPDLVYRRHLRIYPGNGNGTLQAPLGLEMNLSKSYYHVQTADFNRDGRTDLVLTGSAGLVIRYGNGDGTFYDKLVDQSPGIGSLPYTADMNGDGRQDVLFYRSASVNNELLGVRLQNADGTWQAAKSTALVDYFGSLATGDFNEDGKLDVAVSVHGLTANNSTRIQIKLGDGAGNLSDLITYPIDGIQSPALAVGDFDLDFHLDLALTADRTIGVVPTSFYVMRGIGEGHFATQIAGTLATDDTDIIVNGDFNKDGRPDLLLSLHQADHLSTFLNTAARQNSIRGRIWEDTNQNGNFDSGELPLSARTVWADQNDNNIVDAGEMTAITRTDGFYDLTVPNGTYKVRQLLPAGWIQTLPASEPGVKPDAYTVVVSGYQIRSGWNFPAYFLGTISGRIFNDSNASKAFENYESTLSGRTVYVDLDHSGGYTAGEPFSVTGSDGMFKLTAKPGTYVIRDIPVAGWYVTDVAGRTVTIGQGQAAYHQDFGRTQRGGISGTLYYDIEAKGYPADSNSGIAGVRVYLDRDGDRVYDPPTPGFSGEPTAITNALGHYSIGDQFPGPVSVRIAKPAGYLFTDPVPNAAGDAAYSAFIFGGAAGSNTDFGLIYPAYVAGRVFNDKDKDGVVDVGEAGFSDIYVYVDYNGNGSSDLHEPSAITDSTGAYRLTSSIGGQLPVIALRPSGFNATLPSSSRRVVNFVQGQTVAGAMDFGFVQGPFSNAPYQSPVNIMSGSNPVALAAGDFNGDGKSDFVVANNFYPGQIFLGQGNGLFTQGPEFNMGSATRFMVAADLNADGKLDLVAANQDDMAVGVLLGKGNGTFQPLVLYPAVAGTYGVAVADFNGDGKLDIVAAGNADNHFAFLAGSGNGAFSAAQLFETEFGGVSISAGDVNKDNKPDLVIANSADSSVTYHPGNGNGTFGNRVRLTAGVNQPSFVTLADLNADARPDLVFLNEFSDQVVVQLGTGTGSFGAPKNFSTASTPQQVSVFDVDRDGRMDLVVSCRSDGTTDISGAVSILRGNGDGTFQSHLLSTAHTSPTAVAIADFNADSKLDIVTANFFSSDVSLLLNGTPGQLGSISGIVWSDADVDGVWDAGETGLANRTVFADVDQDGVLDPGERFTTTTSNGVYLLSGLPAGTYRILPVTTADYAQSSPVNRKPLTVALSAGQKITGRHLGLAPTAFDGGVVIDNSAAKLTGVWSASTAAAGFFGGNVLTDENTGKGSKASRFDAQLPFDGYYRVSVRWTSGADRATNVPMDILSGSNTRTLSINQRLDGGKWIDVGVYYFLRSGGAVVIRNDATNGLVVADAVRFVPAPTPAMWTKDNADPTGVTITGSWNTSTAVAGYFGSNFLTDGNPAVKGTRSVTMAPGSLGSTGVFEVFARWTSAANRATNARYDILTTSGIRTVLVNQQTRGSQWVSLGYFSLNGFGATVTIRNDGANGLVIADALQFVRVSL